MTYGDALNALEVGFRCRFRGIPVIVAGVEVRRMVRIDHNGRPYCIGDRFYCCNLLGAGISGGHFYEGRLEELMTEEEYQKSLNEE